MKNEKEWAIQQYVEKEWISIAVFHTEEEMDIHFNKIVNKIPKKYCRKKCIKPYIINPKTIIACHNFLGEIKPHNKVIEDKTDIVIKALEELLFEINLHELKTQDKLSGLWF